MQRQSLCSPKGEVGVYGVRDYAVRPDVCKACVPGDHACDTARRYFGLPAIELRPSYMDEAVTL